MLQEKVFNLELTYDELECVLNLLGAGWSGGQWPHTWPPLWGSEAAATSLAEKLDRLEGEYKAETEARYERRDTDADEMPF